MQGNLVRAAYLIGAIVVLSYGDTDLVVAAIARGGDDGWNNRHAAGRDCQARLFAWARYRFTEREDAPLIRSE
jgi:hypothetical protein